MRVWLVRHSGAGLVARVGVRACVCACELGSCVFVFAVCITLLIVWLGVDLRVCGGVRHISAFQRAWNVGVCVCVRHVGYVTALHCV